MAGDGAEDEYAADQSKEVNREEHGAYTMMMIRRLRSMAKVMPAAVRKYRSEGFSCISFMDGWAAMARRRREAYSHWLAIRTAGE